MNRRHRLRGRRAFAAVRAGRRGASSGPVRVDAIANGLTVARIGFVITRAVGGAVVRNRVRRRLRAALAPRLADLAGLDLVVVTRPQVGELSPAGLREHLERCLAAVAGPPGAGRAAGMPGRAEHRVEDNEPRRPVQRAAPGAVPVPA